MRSLVTATCGLLLAGIVLPADAQQRREPAAAPQGPKSLTAKAADLVPIPSRRTASGARAPAGLPSGIHDRITAFPSVIS